MCCSLTVLVTKAAKLEGDARSLSRKELATCSCEGPSHGGDKDCPVVQPGKKCDVFFKTDCMLPRKDSEQVLIAVPDRTVGQVNDSFVACCALGGHPLSLCTALTADTFKDSSRSDFVEDATCDEFIDLFCAHKAEHEAELGAKRHPELSTLMMRSRRFNATDGEAVALTALDKAMTQKR